MEISNDRCYAFATEPVSHSMSSYRVHHDGSLTLLNANAASLGNVDPRDQDLSADGALLYVLNK